ncbi:hypothetical protein BUALT_Bualt10G0024800 [Buddleja alternifolia]|uniref:Agenet domain-containing protein n=1 Tax=Buddleja alternifolia TaxID=168488 RepID=A0AAV6X6D6_9LAMI|nr:hypothetical protein BUALT_Bualt10G0024800 [Buddleja alternifolia]
MDYNGNDYEGQNLHLAGEENSKISSVLRPFALPKFDFEDNLHGHLRFDSLVENEVFLGIPSQEDNQWIEDYSRGSSGIEFSSSAAESCALPRRNNVWSEATSSESVEMLLKAVGQEEMVPGENMIEESDPGGQLDSSTRQMENNMRQEDIVDDIDNGNPSLPPAEVQGIFSKTDQSAGVEEVQAQETIVSSNVVCVDSKESGLIVPNENPDIDMKRTTDNQGETLSLVSESLCSQVQESLPVLGIEIDNTESSSQIISVSVRESVDQDKTSDISLIRSNSIEKGTSHAVEEQKKGCNENDERLSVSAIETFNPEMQSSLEIPLKMESSKEEHAVKVHPTNFSKASSLPGKGESASTYGGCNEIAYVVQPAVGNEIGTVEICSGKNIEKLYEAHSILCEKSSVPLEGEGHKEGLDIIGSEVITPSICGNPEWKQVPVVQPSDQHESRVDNVDIGPESDSSLEALRAGFESSMLREVLRNHSENNSETNINRADDPSNSTDSRTTGECREDKSVVDDVRDASDNTSIQKENLEDGDHVSHPPIVGSRKTCRENIVYMQVDGHESDLDVSTCEKEDKKSPLYSSNMACDDNGEVKGSSSSGEGVKVNAGTAQPPSVSGDPSGKSPLVFLSSFFFSIGMIISKTFIILNRADSYYMSNCLAVLNTEVEDTKLTSSCVEGDEVVVCRERSRPSCDGYMDESEETESEALKEPSTSVSKDSLESNELSPAIGTKKGTLPDSAAAGGTQRGDGSLAVVDTSSVAMMDEACKKLSEKMEHPATDLIVQDDGVEAASTEKPMETEIERSHGTNFSTVSVKNCQCSEFGLVTAHYLRLMGCQWCQRLSYAMISVYLNAVTSCSMDIDKSNQHSVTGAVCTELSQSVIKKKESLKRNNTENVGEVLSASMNPGVNDLSKEDGTFTFDVRPLGSQSTGHSGKDLQSFPTIQACRLSLTGEGSPVTIGNSQKDPIIGKKVSDDSSSTPAGCAPSGGPTGPSERKTRRSSTRSGKGSAKKGNHVKEPTPLRQIERGDKSSVSLSPLEAGRLMTFESIVKPKGTVSIPTSSLPDLNTSTTSPAFFQQPFTDLQQVQLRAQIFVYGSLIQGAAPDEACMVSAFDGGRSFWEPSWRACVEKFHGQKPQGHNIETPVHSRSGARAPDQTHGQSFPQSEVLSSVAGRASNKAIPSPRVNPMIPLSSPLWSISTPSCEALPSSSMPKSAVLDYQAVSPLHPYQTPPVRNFVARTTWPSQAPFQVPWLASSQSSPFDISAKYSAFPVTEPVKLTPVRDSSLPISSGTKHVLPIPATHSGAATMFAGASSLDVKNVKVSTGQTDTKTRKRKKSSGAADVQISVIGALADTASAVAVANSLSKKTPAVEDLCQTSLSAPDQADFLSTPVITSHYSTSVAVATPYSLVPKGTTNQFLSALSPSISTDLLNRGDSSMDKRALHVEDFSKVEEAKLQAEEAAAHANAAISHCEGVWSQLNQQKNTGLTSDAESKLAAAAVAIAAAASVAKAAAAAAKIASSAAVQAKQMADEAVTKPGTVGSTEYDASTNMARTSSSLAISAVREAARKKVEAASAATRHAENLDAIVKAAELAAEAVSHAGKIVTMGDPFSLSELVEAGPYSYWKVSQVASVPGSKTNDMNKNKSINSNAGEVPNAFMNQCEEPDKNMQAVVSSTQRESSRNMVDDHVTTQENLIATVKNGEKNLPQKDKRVSDLAKSAGVVSEPDIESTSNSRIFNSYESTSSIKEGSLVEVLRDHGDLKGAWFSASVLSLRDGEALVCYNELQSNEGSELLKEWVPLEAKDGCIPKVRIPHPMTAVQFEGTRKRRRAAVKDYGWSVGDKVDAWVHDCWREGVVAEKNKEDGTALSVHFPAQGETSMIKVWHIRPTLIWSDGQWIEWCRPGQDDTLQGDTPVEKRQKLRSTTIETKGMAKNIGVLEIGRNEESRLPLSAKEKVFNMGSIKEEKKPNRVGAVRSGLEKERSRVVFGVPKPGKKRKFMEVSKHYVSDRSAKTNLPNDSMKLAKSKNNSKLDFKGKQVAESKPKPLRSGKPPSIPSRTLPRKDDSTSSRPNSRDASVENESGEQNLAEFRSFASVEETSRGNMVFSSRALPQDHRKRAAIRNTKSERLNQGKLAPAGGRAAKNEANESLISDVSEPRRSNRRIQPTSRLLEGLQSSLIISKGPSSSHSKGTSKGDNQLLSLPFDFYRLLFLPENWLSCRSILTMTQDLFSPAIFGPLVTITRDTHEPIPPPLGAMIGSLEIMAYASGSIPSIVSPFLEPIIPSVVPPAISEVPFHQHAATLGLPLVTLQVHQGNSGFPADDRGVYYVIGGSNTLDRNNNIP